MRRWRTLEAWLTGGSRACLVTLVRAEGSSPREPGAWMLVREDGRHSGSIGGGALEWQALAMAQGLFAETPAGRGLIRRFALGPELGQCCGGAVDLLFEAFAAGDRSWIGALAAAEASGPFRTRGRADARGVFLRGPVDASGPPPAEGSMTARLESGILSERHGTARTALLLFGAGHVGRALVLALAPLPFDLRWIDSRADAFPSHLPENAVAVHAPHPVTALASATPGAFVLAVTHSHALDLAIADAALKLPDLGYLGVIGSATKRARFRSRLAASGVPATALDRLICPIGLPSITGKHPAVIAASVAAQLLEAREALMKNGASAPENRPARSNRVHAAAG